MDNIAACYKYAADRWLGPVLQHLDAFKLDRAGAGGAEAKANAEAKNAQEMWYHAFHANDVQLGRLEYDDWCSEWDNPDHVLKYDEVKVARRNELLRSIIMPTFEWLQSKYPLTYERYKNGAVQKWRAAPFLFTLSYFNFEQAGAIPVWWLSSTRGDSSIAPELVVEHCQSPQAGSGELSQMAGFFKTPCARFCLFVHRVLNCRVKRGFFGLNGNSFQKNLRPKKAKIARSAIFKTDENIPRRIWLEEHLLVMSLPDIC